MYGKFGFCSVFSPTHHFDYYFWIDFAGVNQYNLREKHLGMSVLCAFAAATVEIIMYNSSTASYEPRAWTRLERMLGYMAFSGDLDLVCSVFQTFVLQRNPLFSWKKIWFKPPGTYKNSERLWDNLLINWLVGFLNHQHYWWWHQKWQENT